MPEPDLSERALETAFRVHRDLNGPSRKPPVLDRLPASGGRVPLPQPVVGLDAELGGVLASRRSWYRFGVRQPSVEQVSSLLGWALGPQRTVTLPDGGRRRMSMAPSAGGLPSVAAFLLVRPDGALPAGVYRYDAAGHDLSGVRAGDPGPALRSVLAQPEFADVAPMAVALVARLAVGVAKYPARHYRTVHVDAGIAAQNVYLVATALGLGGCAVTGFDDAGLAAVLDLDEASFPVVVFPFGRLPASGMG